VVASSLFGFRGLTSFSLSVGEVPLYCLHHILKSFDLVVLM
jgi:hypothetical protein